jgi:D-lactate dehydrogenase
MGLDDKLRELANLCVEAVIVPANVGCCGFAGDRGFSHPELTEAALSQLRASLPSSCAVGYSTSKTCEIGLSQHGRIPYHSIAYLVDECTERSGPGGLPVPEGL